MKKKYGNIYLVDSDVVFEGWTLAKVLFLGLGGGFIAGALGLGGGVLFNPLLLTMGVPPMVSKATSLYLITFSKVITCIVYFIYGQLIIDYSAWVAFVSVIGGLSGVAFAIWYINRFKK